MADLKQFVYHYNDDPNHEEPFSDFDDDTQLPDEGQVIVRNGKAWKVGKIVKSEVLRPKRFDLYRIYLVED